MKQSLKSLLGDTLQAVDGDIGTVRDFYFDDRTWTIRYLVADTTGWWPGGRHVLLSPAAFLAPLDWDAGFFPVRLTRTEVRRSPEIDLAKPVSQQEEERLARHYQWPIYWQSPMPGLWYGPLGPFMPSQSIPLAPSAAAEETSRNNQYHLRSFRELRRYHVLTREGDTGKLKDLLVDEHDWSIHWMVVDAAGILPGREVLVAPRWITAVDWQASAIRMDRLHRQDLEGSPVYDPRLPLTPENEERYYRYFHKQQ